jgi:Zn-dependent peptidase ImmA (M78 family)
LVVKTGVNATLAQSTSVPLGRITFTPLLIEIFAADQPHRARERFTLAHELAHHLLDHGKFLTREYCEEDDFVLHQRSAIGSSDVSRLEFQANYFALSLLMPRGYFLEDFQRLARNLDISDHGFGALYLDDQPCNLQTFREVTNHFMLRYGVSRTSAKIRLESLGLLNDARQVTSTRQALRLFGVTDQE